MNPSNVVGNTIFNGLVKALREKNEGKLKNNQFQNMITVKFEYEDEKRKVKLGMPLKFEELQARVWKDFRPNVLMRCLISKENQVFHTLTDQSSLNHAIQLVSRTSENSYLYIQVIPCSEEKNSQSSPKLITSSTKDDSTKISPSLHIKSLPPSTTTTPTNLSTTKALPKAMHYNTVNTSIFQQPPSTPHLSQFTGKSNSFPVRNKKPEQTWRRGRLLGSGAFGQVFICCDVETGREYAVKQVHIFSKNSQNCSNEVKMLKKEIEYLKEGVKHPNIVQYHGCHDNGEVFSILMEYMPGSSVKDQIKQYGRLTERNTFSYTKQVLRGLEFLHRKSIVHRDVKGANILRDNEGRVKLSDFGASKRLQTISSSIMQTQTGTTYYMSPELLNGDGYGRKTDVWSLGCTVVEMLTGQPPWHQLECFAAIFKIVTSTESGYELPEGTSENAKDFLKQCFQRSVSLRPTSSQLTDHPFIKSQPPRHLETTTGNGEKFNTIDFKYSLDDDGGEIGSGELDLGMRSLTLDGKVKSRGGTELKPFKF